MKHLKCIVIDDEPLAIEVLKKYIREFPFLQLMETFEDAISGAEFLRLNKVDLLFIDITMPDITGIDLVKSLSQRPMIIFTTAHKNFAFEGFELEAIDYLLKPINMQRFDTAVKKAHDFFRFKNEDSNPASESIFVHSEYRVVKILLKDIEYIESMQDYIKVYFTGVEKPVLTLMPLKNIIDKLPPEDFARIHRSFVVATKKIRSVHNRKVQLSNAELPVGNSYADAIRGWAKF